MLTATTGANTGLKNEKVQRQLWNCEQDLFVFVLSDVAERANGLPVTKRSIFKVIAGMYDPIGLLSPVLVEMGVLFQVLCVSKVEWDKRLTDEFEKCWRGWLRDLKEAKELHVPRCVYGVVQSKLNCSLHGFAHARKMAYCAIIYFVCEAPGIITPTLLPSKARVSPLMAQKVAQWN